MAYSNVKVQRTGRDFNFFLKVSVNWSTFGGGASDGAGPDMIIPFMTQGLIFLNEGTGVVEYSFDGVTLHGEMDSTLASKGLSFDNRVVSPIWTRVKAGSSGPIVCSFHAWSTH